VFYRPLFYLPCEITAKELVNQSVAIEIHFSSGRMLYGKLIGSAGELGPLMAQFDF
jgi:hypothetical protein